MRKPGREKGLEAVSHVNGLGKQEFHPMESCRYGSSARQCVVLNLCSDNAVHARGGMFVTSWVQVDFPAITWDLLQGGGGGSINNKLVLVRTLRWLEVDGLKCLVRYGAVDMEPSF